MQHLRNHSKTSSPDWRLATRLSHLAEREPLTVKLFERLTVVPGATEYFVRNCRSHSAVGEAHGQDHSPSRTADKKQAKTAGAA